ncbi:MAG: DUF1549 domain-containing protein [Isosphaeraceae bacterium]
MTVPRQTSAIVLLATWLCPALHADAQEPVAKVPPEHAANAAKGLALFKEKVRPILVSHCVECHGGKATKGDFDLTDRETLVSSGAIEGGGKASQLYGLVTHAEEPHMPHKRPKLPAADAELLATWIDLGAPYDRPLVDRQGNPDKPSEPAAESRDHWAFQPLRTTAPPAVKRGDWVRNPIDQFVVARLEARGLSPNPTADRRTLIRRLSFDLIGLPPTPEEVEAFVNDPRPDAYDQLVDRLLDSPAHGERWARHWMDVARFAESHGYEQDYDRPHAYHYRDFLIKAINADMPYDEFVRWQIAGDEFAPDDPLAMAATGFLGAGAFPTQLTEQEFESARYNELDDMVSTTGTAFLGLTIGCARCHDHKYDPLAMDDYYRLAATFTTAIRSEIDLTMTPGAPSVKVQVTSEGLPPTKHHADDRGFPHFYPKTYVLARGDTSQKQREAEPGFLRVLLGRDRDVSEWAVTPTTGQTRTSYRRATLAAWLTDPDKGAGHLTARVIVNRLWQHHFGRGIVATSSDFGAQGDPPTHPELLDWLAVDLIHNGWKLKRLHKLMVSSAAYTRDSRADKSGMREDPDGTLLWRFTPRRLEAEPIRDAMLFVSGRLDATMFGPGSLDQDMNRRSVYFFIKRSQLIPTMMLFDWPEHLVGIGRRAVTTTAPQALMFLNSALGRSSAQGFASRLANLDPAAAVARAYAIALGRPPSTRETDVATDYLRTRTSRYLSAGKPDPGGLALVDLCQAILGSSEFIYIN